MGIRRLIGTIELGYATSHLLMFSPHIKDLIYILSSRISASLGWQGAGPSCISQVHGTMKSGLAKDARAVGRGAISIHGFH